jgi:hypothetical protein
VSVVGAGPRARPVAMPISSDATTPVGAGPRARPRHVSSSPPPRRRVAPARNVPRSDPTQTRKSEPAPGDDPTLPPRSGRISTLDRAADPDCETFRRAGVGMHGASGARGRARGPAPTLRRRARRRRHRERRVVAPDDIGIAHAPTNHEHTHHAFALYLTLNDC